MAAILKPLTMPNLSPSRYETASPPSVSSVDVHRIDSGSCSTEAVVMVKLTDELYNLLSNSKKPVRVKVDEQGGVLEVGDGSSTSIFRFQKQNLQGEPTDALVQHSGGFVSNVGIQATDKSLDETRKRAEKRAEEEKNRGTKHVKQRKDLNGKSRLVASTSTTSRPPTTSSLASGSSQRIPSSAPPPPSTSAQKNGIKPDVLRGELKRQPLRSRVIHLVVTQRFKNSEEIFKKLRSDGVAEETDLQKRVEEMVRELSEQLNDRLSLKTTYYPKVDPRWPFYTPDEKAKVRKLLAAGSGVRPAQLESSSFAPMRKSGMERMHPGRNADKSASTVLTPQGQTVSPEAIPTPPMSRPASGGSTASAKTSSAPRDSPISDEDTIPLMPTGVKRKAHVPNVATSTTTTSSKDPEGATSEKRPRRLESASPPDDPTTTSMLHHGVQSSVPNSATTAMSKLMNTTSLAPPSRSTYNNVGSANNGGGSTASSRISSPASSLSSPSQPSCDWEKNFGEIKTLEEAEDYFSMFHKEYPMYMKYYGVLTEVSKEFRNLEQKLNSANKKGTGKDVAHVEREIQKRFAHYEKNPDFLRARQQHTDLRSKLAVLKSRITNWEIAQERALSRGS
ncbi:unnamed protein product [Caenorhabditis auriculariae]|uniref:OCEL domain-containing protein n=1 Tax=Caenorhabditis auriculariae TaxID=2777116 RepID=A0A8S1HHG8_9PELO|nr:unnamed protein product [Caenorhabditis auriculariae]